MTQKNDLLEGKLQNKSLFMQLSVDSKRSFVKELLDHGIPIESISRNTLTSVSELESLLTQESKDTL